MQAPELVVRAACSWTDTVFELLGCQRAQVFANDDACDVVYASDCGVHVAGSFHVVGSFHDVGSCRDLTDQAGQSPALTKNERAGHLELQAWLKPQCPRSGDQKVLLHRNENGIGTWL